MLIDLIVCSVWKSDEWAGREIIVNEQLNHEPSATTFELSGYIGCTIAIMYVRGPDLHGNWRTMMNLIALYTWQAALC